MAVSITLVVILASDRLVTDIAEGFVASVAVKGILSSLLFVDGVAVRASGTELEVDVVFTLYKVLLLELICKLFWLKRILLLQALRLLFVVLQALSVM